MARLESHEDCLIGVFGGRGTGKSYRIKQLIKGKSRLLIWDLQMEYPGHPIDGNLTDLSRWLKRKKFKVAFRPNMADLKMQFAMFCRMAMAIGNMHVVVEELNAVTKPSWSPPEWKNVTSRGRHRGLKIIGASQTPAGVDKDFISNMTECYAGRMTFDAHWRSLQCIFGADARKIPTMPNHEQLHWKA